MGKILRLQRQAKLKRTYHSRSNEGIHKCHDCAREYTQPVMIPFIGTNNTYDDNTEWFCLRCYNKRFGG